ncbi:hypothetical protein C7974DRAFT_411382 [Boeremia exigua]|uniref:uncharacterized protein n=1 Tax=Boeremia exigua TaxID=749465 RepID=UPI001E8D8211|nr:uncharacterized protein C7974DRAFT_411382 [Boeremia exigua]KAH6637926.1 hypothetical protein C7974DRAFT_411382 [Boeremia exigua]
MEDDAVKSEPEAPQDQQQSPSRPRHKRVNTDETERPASAQQSRDDTQEHAGAETEENISDDDEEADPAVQIANFDWDDLHRRYHAAIKECSQEEQELMQEWRSLMEYFAIWANSGHEHETDRTFRRLQTRTMYVKNEENKLEETRNHYISVVRAFESALNLLRRNVAFRG